MIHQHSTTLQSALVNYLKLRKRLSHSISSARTILLVGFALALSVVISTSSAQTSIGPFTQNKIENPLPPPQVGLIAKATPVYADLDADGDLDLIIGERLDAIHYFQNIGNATTPFFTELIDGKSGNPFAGLNLSAGGSNTVYPALVDVDDDGDLDLVVGRASNEGSVPAFLLFFRNTGTPTDPFFEDDFANSPFAGIAAQKEAFPVFTDVDVDGDQDLVLGGIYPGELSTTHHLVQYFKNTKADHAAGEDATFTSQLDAQNPFYIQDDPADAAMIAFADLDEDGDQDYFFRDDKTLTRYFRNDNGTYVEQTTSWVPDLTTPGNSTGNPVKGLDLDDEDTYVPLSFADLDGDGDLDVTIGTSYLLISGSGLKYARNTGQGVFELQVGLSNFFEGVDAGNSSVASVTDLDGDGDGDILVSGTNQIMNCPFDEPCTFEIVSIITVYENVDGSFIDVSRTPKDPFYELEFDGGGRIKLIDVDGDDDLDLVIPTFTPEGTINGYVQYFQNDAGTYVHKTGAENPLDFIGTAEYAIDLDLADLDGDGLPDLIFGGYGSTMRIYKNEGTTSGAVFNFLQEQWSMGLVSTSPGEASPKFVDIDNDGDLDITVGQGEAIWFYLNTGTATNPVFVECKDQHDYPDDPTTPDNPFKDIYFLSNPSVVLYDRDGDGDDDLLLGNDFGQFDYFENTNPSPAVGIESTTLQFDGGTPVFLDATMTVNDLDGDLIGSAEIVLSPYESGKETLVIVGVLPDGITSSLTAGTDPITSDPTLTLLLKGPAPVVDFEGVLRTVQYSHVAGGGAGGRMSAGREVAKIIKLKVVDIENTLSAVNNKTMNATHSDDAPVLAPVTAAADYSNSAVVIHPAVTTADDDDADMLSASISISSGYIGAEDLLLFTSQNGISGTFNPISGVLLLSGQSSLANYQAALRSVQYNNSSPTPTVAPRSITFTINDGDNDSNTSIATVNILASNAPVIASGGTPITYGGVPIVVSNSMTLSDPNDASLQSATIMFNSGFAQGQDQLLFTNTANITGIYNATTGILSLTGTAPLAEYETALESVQYQNTSATPDKTNRVISFAVSDGTESSNAVTIAVSFINAPPVLAPSTAVATYSGTSVAIHTTVAVTDDDANQASATISIVTGLVVGEDVLVFTDQNGITGTYSPSFGVLNLSGSATIAVYQAALQSVQYSNSSSTPVLGNRTIEFYVSDGTSNSNISTVTLTVINASPVLSSTATPQTYTAGDLVLDNTLTVADVDNTDLVSAQVSITTGFATGQDELLFTDQNGIAGSYDVATGILSLSGTASLADYETALRSVGFRNTSTDRQGGARTILVTVNDGGSNSNAVALNINIPSIAPTISGTSSVFYANGTLVINNSIVVGDADNSTLQAASVQITSGANTSEDVLLFTDQNGITGSYANGTLSLSGLSNIANYQDALRSVRYQNTSSTPSTDDRIITFKAFDGAGPSPGVTSTITINKAPVITASEQGTQAGGNIAFLANDILSDPDNNLDLTTLEVSSKAGATISVNDGVITINYSNLDEYKGTDEITIKVCDTGGRCQTSVIFIEVGAEALVFNGISPNGDGVNDAFYIKFLPPGTRVSIFNRWGDAVFETNDYDNNDANRRFEGFSKNGTELNAGSYFYKVSFPDGTDRTGYLLLKR